MIANEQRHRRSAAFFDVDETLVNLKTMQSFLNHYFGSDAGIRPWDRFQQGLGTTPRADGNRRYYRLWKDESLADVEAAGRAWFARVRHQPDFYVEETLRRLEAHRRCGDLVFLISGSFHPCLAPLASALKVDGVYGTILQVSDGRLTGEVLVSRIGEGKRDAFTQAVSEHFIDPRRTWAYGDHPSDAPLLSSARRPYVVRPDATMRDMARQHGWPTLTFCNDLEER